jgi:hypothetical protein
MPSKPGRRVRCGAKSRQNDGAGCKNWAVDGAERCRMHGGTHPKGGEAPQATQRLVHGLYAKAFTAEEKERFEEVFGEMLADPTTAMMADAALMRVKAMTAAGRADASGMLTTRQSAHKRTEPVIDPDTGKPRMYRTEDGKMAPLTSVVETVSADRQDVMGPVADLLMRAHRLAESSVMLKKRADLGDAPGDASRLEDREVADIFRAEFADAGAYGEKDEDGPSESQGAGGDSGSTTRK